MRRKSWLWSASSPRRAEGPGCPGAFSRVASFIYEILGSDGIQSQEHNQETAKTDSKPTCRPSFALVHTRMNSRGPLLFPRMLPSGYFWKSVDETASIVCQSKSD